MRATVEMTDDTEANAARLRSLTARTHYWTLRVKGYA